MRAVMACIVIMAYLYGLHSYGLHRYICSYGLHSYGPHSYGPYSYGVCDSGRLASETRRHLIRLGTWCMHACTHVRGQRVGQLGTAPSRRWADFTAWVWKGVRRGWLAWHCTIEEIGRPHFLACDHTQRAVCGSGLVVEVEAAVLKSTLSWARKQCR